MNFTPLDSIRDMSISESLPMLFASPAFIVAVIFSFLSLVLFAWRGINSIRKKLDVMGSMTILVFAMFLPTAILFLGSGAVEEAKIIEIAESNIQEKYEIKDLSNIRNKSDDEFFTADHSNSTLDSPSKLRFIFNKETGEPTIVTASPEQEAFAESLEKTG